MQRITRSLAIIILAGAVAPVAVNAAPFGKMLLTHPATSNTKDGRVSFTLINKSNVARDVTVDGHTYTLVPNKEITVSALPGSAVTDGASNGATPGKVLFMVNRTHKGATVSLN
jgi:hypothetical protein